MEEELEESKDDWTNEVFENQLEESQELGRKDEGHVNLGDTQENGWIDDQTDDEDSDDDLDYEGPMVKENRKRPKTKETQEDVNTIASPGKLGIPRKIKYNKFLCSVCEIYFQKKERMLNHVKRKHGPALPRECSLCLQTFIKGSQLKYHKSTVHRDLSLKQDSQPPSQCEICSRIFTTRKRLNYHKSTAHKEKIPCEDCGKLYPAAYIKGHMKQAHSEKSRCTICGKQVRALKDHMASLHTADSEKQFHCEQCGKGFVNQRSLNDHMNIHLNIRPYACR